jgi:hypothetical protein
VRLDADVEPHRTVEGRLLMQQQVGELIAERVGVRRGCEVALRFTPAADRAHDAPDHLPDAVLTIGAAEGAAEVLRDDDVGGELRPSGRNLHIVLLEDDLALLVLDDGAAPLPLDALEGILVGDGEVASYDQAGSRRCRALC